MIERVEAACKGMEMRAQLAAVVWLGTVLILSPAQAQMTGARPDIAPLPPGSRAHVTVTASLLELLLALRLGSPAPGVADRPEIAQPHLRRHAARAAAAAQMALAAAPGPIGLTPP